MCRFRLFIGGAAEMCSAWLLVLITADRWIRTQFPFKSNSICTRKNAIFASLSVIFIFVGLNLHVLLSYYGSALPGKPGVSWSTFIFINDL